MTSDSEAVESKLPCNDCGSSDAVTRYDDGHTFCFSCNTNRGSSGKKAEVADGLIRDLRYQSIPPRRISEEIAKKFGYGLTGTGETLAQVAPYFLDGKMVGQKVRKANKQFYVHGNAINAELFGQRLWSQGGKRLVITEGEVDAMSYAEATNGTWPVVSVPNGAAGALKAVKRNAEFVESFDEVVVLFDMDDPGQDAAQAVAEYLTPGKAKIAHLPLKDASDMIVAGQFQELRQAIWNAVEVRPDGIINGADLWDEVAKDVTMGMPYPWAFLNENSAWGMRGGEITTWVAGSGQGKSAFVAEIAYDQAIRHHAKVGYIALEENCGRTGLRFMGIHGNMPLHLPGQQIDPAEKRRLFDETLGTGRLFFYDHFGSMDSDHLLNKIRFMVKGLGVTTVVLDHLSIVVSGMDLDGDERRMIDHTMTNLRSLTEETGVNMQLVSHLKRPNGQGHEDGAITSLSQLRGSAAIAQLSDVVIGIERNQQATNPKEKNTSVVRILKNRYSGVTGEMGGVIYDNTTGRLTPTSIEEAFGDPLPKGFDDDAEIPF